MAGEDEHIPTIRRIVKDSKKRRIIVEVVNDRVELGCSVCGDEFLGINIEDAHEAFQEHFAKFPRCSVGWLTISADIVRG